MESWEALMLQHPARLSLKVTYRLLSIKLTSPVPDLWIKVPTDDPKIRKRLHSLNVLSRTYPVFLSSSASL